MSGTNAGQISLKALAHKALQRDKWRDKCGTSAYERAGQNRGNCPGVVPVDLRGLGNALKTKNALNRAVQSLWPAGRLERFAAMTDAEMDEYAARFGVTGAELVAAIFDPGHNAEYIRQHGTGGRP